MDRLIVPVNLMNELNNIPRSMLGLITSVRYAYTGMDICEDSSLQYDVCSGKLTKNIGLYLLPKC